MYGLTTLAKLNREADEAHRIVSAHSVGSTPVIATLKIAPAAERLATMNKLLNGAKG